jgi:hypothetical protein
MKADEERKARAAALATLEGARAGLDDALVEHREARSAENRAHTAANDARKAYDAARAAVEKLYPPGEKVNL